MGRRANQTLTQKLVDQAKPIGKQYVMGDLPTPGLRLWVGINGTKRWQIRKPGSTKPIILDFTTTTLEQARLAATSPEPPKPPPARLASIGSLIDHYAQIKGAGWSKRTDAPKRCRLFLEPILNRSTTALTKPWIEDRQEQLLATDHLRGTPYKGTSVESYRKCSASFALWLVEEGYLPKSPFRKLRRIPVDPAIRVLTEANMAKLRRACWKYRESEVMATRVMLALCAGMRRGEIGLVEKSDIDLKEEVIRLRAATTKSRKPRSFHLCADLINFLDETLPNLPDKRPLFIRSADYHFKKLLAFANLDQAINFHGLRHSWATSALRRKGNVRTVQSQLGHASLTTTQIYVHALAEDSRELAHLMDGRYEAVA